MSRFEHFPGPPAGWRQWTYCGFAGGGGSGGRAGAARASGAGPVAAAASCGAGWWEAMWIRRRAVGVSSASASEGSTSSAAWTEMGSWMRMIGGRLKQRLRLDVGREICRQYPLFCFLLLCLSVASLLLNRYLPSAPGRPLGSPRAVLAASESKLLTVASGGTTEVAAGHTGGGRARTGCPWAGHPPRLRSSEPLFSYHFSKFGPLSSIFPQPKYPPQFETVKAIQSLEGGRFKVLSQSQAEPFSLTLVYTQSRAHTLVATVVSRSFVCDDCLTRNQKAE